MNYRLILLNSFLVILLVIGGLNLRNLATAYELTHQPKYVLAMPESLPKLGVSAVPSSATPEDWTDIPTKNLFSFDRTDVTLVAPPPPPPQNVGPKPILFAIMTLGKERTAMVAPGQSANRMVLPLHVGQTMDGWTITDIQDRQIVVSANNKQETVILNDPTTQVPRAVDRTAASGGSTMAPSPAAVVPAGGGTKAPGKTKVIQTPFGPKVVPADDPPQN